MTRSTNTKATERQDRKHQLMVRIDWKRVVDRITLALKAAAALAGIAGVGFLLFLLAGVFHEKVPTNVERTGKNTSVGLPSSELQKGEVRRVRRPQFETAVGTVKPVHEVALASKLLAKVVEVRAKAGQVVEQGELLVRLDDADLVARMRQAEAALQSAAASRERAAADLDRAKSLLSSNAISRAEYDAAIAAARTSSAEYDRLRESIEEARVLLSYAEVRSPIEGTIVDKRIEVGDTASPGQVLLSLYDPKRMQLVASVRESLAQRLRVGQEVPARLNALDQDCLATISEIVPESNVASRTFQVKVTGPCPPGVYSGMFGRLMIPLDDEEVLVVPASAVRHIGQLAIVDVVRDGTTHRRSVQLGRVFVDEVEVLSGLRAGEQVVLFDPKERS